MTTNKRNILLTRPLDKSLQLAKVLTPIANCIEITPLFGYENGTDHSFLVEQLQNIPWYSVIFISPAAVKFALSTISPSQLKKIPIIIAVGSATAQALKSHGIDDVLMPKEHSSEGVLALTQLHSIENKNVLIIRGNGGRETIKQELDHRGANVAYNDVYTRVWFDLPPEHTIDLWRKSEINCIVVTSNQILDKMLSYIANNQWLKQCTWIVVSTRIADKANAYGLTPVIIANGAGHDKILQAIQAATKPTEVNYD